LFGIIITFYFSIPLSEDEQKAENFYNEAMKYLSKDRQTSKEAKKTAYRWLDEAAHLNHTKAMEIMGKLSG
jgi:hypothetical protein